MPEHTRRDQPPSLPDWMKRYDISVGPYDQPAPPAAPQKREEHDRDERQRPRDDQR